MEGAGSARAAYVSDLPGVLLVKGISDWADAQKNDDWQPYASDVAATFVIELLRQTPLPSAQISHRPQPQRLNAVQFLGQAKLRVCERLTYDWPDLADYFDIPLAHRAKFERGREPQGVWEWVEQRHKLGGLKLGLEFAKRGDLVSELHGA